MVSFEVGTLGFLSAYENRPSTQLSNSSTQRSVIGFQKTGLQPAGNRESPRSCRRSGIRARKVQKNAGYRVAILFHMDEFVKQQSVREWFVRNHTMFPKSMAELSDH